MIENKQIPLITHENASIREIWGNTNRGWQDWEISTIKQELKLLRKTVKTLIKEINLKFKNGPGIFFTTYFRKRHWFCCVIRNWIFQVDYMIIRNLLCRVNGIKGLITLFNNNIPTSVIYSYFREGNIYFITCRK